MYFAVFNRMSGKNIEMTGNVQLPYYIVSRVSKISRLLRKKVKVRNTEAC